jgi:choline-sulfatase
VTHSDQPNILLLMSDQHNRDYLGCAGHPFVRTAHLDRLAASGTRFTNAYCANPLCGPSRMAFLTSRSSSDIRMWNNGAHLASDVATFVHHLVAAGYQTILCGRMHFDGPDRRHGYERRILGEQQWIAPSISHNRVTAHTAGHLEYSGWGRTPWMMHDQDVATAAVRFLKSAEARGADHPWFLTVGTSLPHDPCICPKELFDEYHPHAEVPPLPDGYLDSLHPATRQWRSRAGVDAARDDILRSARAGYCGLVTFEDAILGTVLDALEENGLSENTIVIYCSDHGDMAGHLRMWWKTTFYDGSCGVPLIISWPGRFRAGAVEHSVCSLLDVGPTLVEIAGGGPMPAVRGRSLMRFVEAQPPAGLPAWPDTAYAEKVYRPQMREPARMIRRGRWKLNHYHGHDRPELFDLETDPGEWRDLGTDPGHAAVRDGLHEEVLADWSAETILRHFEWWDADRAVRDRFRQAARIPPDEAPDPWTPSGDFEFHRGYDFEGD